MDHPQALTEASTGLALARRSPPGSGRGSPRAGCASAHALGLLALVLAALAASGCASVRWAVVQHFRTPGEEIRDFPEVVWEEYDCALQQRPFFVVEQNELLPARVEAGGDFNHRLVYAMCPVERTEVVSGQLVTRIRFKGRPIVRQSEERWEIKPGRWVVDTSVELPESAEPGVYAYELEFASDSIAFEKHLTFVVRAP